MVLLAGSKAQRKENMIIKVSCMFLIKIIQIINSQNIAKKLGVMMDNGRDFIMNRDMNLNLLINLNKKLLQSQMVMLLKT